MGPVAIAGRCLFQADGVLDLGREGGEDSLYLAQRYLRDAGLLAGVTLGEAQQVIHVDIRILEA